MGVNVMVILTPKWSWLMAPCLPVKSLLFLPTVAVHAQKASSDCWGFVYFIVGSLPRELNSILFLATFLEFVNIKQSQYTWVT